jgi:putative DNA primase/helicase
MTNFTSFLNNLKLASSDNSITETYGFKNISGNEFLNKLRNLKLGSKDGSHFLRTSLKTDKYSKCLSRSNDHTESLANILIIDCDQRINTNNKILDGAPDPIMVSKVLQEHNITHILYGSYSHYEGTKGNRYRIIIPTINPYTKEQLSSTVESVILLINANLNQELLVDSTENSTWSQAWFFPRKPAACTKDVLYIAYLEGKAIEVVIPQILPPPFKQSSYQSNEKPNKKLSPIDAFNKQNALTDLLVKYGYRKKYANSKYEKWIRPNSSSNIAGITVKDNKFFSHHNDAFNDGFWHDAFDLMRMIENLSENEALKYAAKNTFSPDGRTIDEYNKTMLDDEYESNLKLQQSITHHQILKQLITHVAPINFREIANITDEGTKLKSQHFYVIVVETVLELAKKNNWNLCRNHDFIYVYNGEYWNLINEYDLIDFLGNAAEKMTVDKFLARYFNFRENLYKQFLALAHLPKPVRSKDIILVNLKNGTFEISPNNTRLKPFDYNDFITYQLPFEYKPDAIYPLFQSYLEKVLPDKALQNILSEYLGYVFIRTSTLKLEKILLLLGKGANGKSVFYEIARSLLGEQNTSEYSLQSLTDERGYQRAMIANKLVNYASEISGKLETAIFKQIASGEPVEARLPYGTPFIMSDYAKLIFNCNELPKDVEHTEAYFRRFLIIPFNVTIPEGEQDKQLSQKIIASELPGVFNWVLEGLKRLLKQKQFTYSATVEQAKEDYKIESDTVKLFLEEIPYKPSHNSYLTVKLLYQEYRVFCMDNGFKPVNKINFTRRLSNLNIFIDRKNKGNVVYVIKT